jgi:hypothetical protein
VTVTVPAMTSSSIVQRGVSAAPLVGWRGLEFRDRPVAGAARGRDDRQLDT